MEKDSLLLEFSFVTYMDRKDHTTLDGKYMEFSDKIEESIRKVAEEYNLGVDCFRGSIYALGAGRIPEKHDNSGRCVNCNEWVSAQNKGNIIGGLGIGAEYDGKLYCQQHLPKESPTYSKLFPVWERED